MRLRSWMHAFALSAALFPHGCAKKPAEPAQAKDGDAAKPAGEGPSAAATKVDYPKINEKLSTAPLDAHPAQPAGTAAQLVPRPSWLVAANWPSKRVVQDSGSIVTGDRTSWALMMELDDKAYTPESCAAMVQEKLSQEFTTLVVSDGDDGRKLVDGSTSQWVLKSMCGYNPKKELLLYLGASQL